MTARLRSAAGRWSRPLVLGASAVALLAGPGAGGAEAGTCAEVRVWLSGGAVPVGQCDWQSGPDDLCTEDDIKDNGTGVGWTVCVELPVAAGAQ